MADSGITASAPHGQSRLVMGMGLCYALGTFTDNFYKQAAILLAASAHLTAVQGYATTLFALPFILFSAWAGWLADRRSKKSIAITTKSVELVAMLAGAWALAHMFWPGVLAVIFTMGLQATIFGPAINGSIPEHFPLDAIPRVNARIKLASTCAILAGVSMAGFMLDSRFSLLTPLFPLWGLSPFPDDPVLYQQALGRLGAGLFILIVAALGLCSALFLRHAPAQAHAAPFPWLGPLDSLRHTLASRKDKALFFALVSEAWFYGLAALVLISIANLAAVLQYSHATAGLLSAVLTLGIAGGACFKGGKNCHNWRSELAPTAFSMAACLLLAAFTPCLPQNLGPLPLQMLWLGLSLLGCGFCGGMYLIPVTSFIQIRPPADSKGKVQGISNFLCFSTMAIFGALFELIGLLPPALTFALYAACMAGYGAFFAFKVART